MGWGGERGKREEPPATEELGLEEAENRWGSLFAQCPVGWEDQGCGRQTYLRQNTCSVTCKIQFRLKLFGLSAFFPFPLPSLSPPLSFLFLIASYISDLLPTPSCVWIYHPCKHLRRRWYWPPFPSGWYWRTLSHHAVMKAWSGISTSLLLVLCISFPKSDGFAGYVLMYFRQFYTVISW